MSHQREKQAIDCTGYRCEMDREVDLIIAGIEVREDVIEKFIDLQQSQERDWLEFVAENYDFAADT